MADTFDLATLFATIHEAMGMAVAILPAPGQRLPPALARLPAGHQHHASPFCLAVRSTRDGRGCRGHDMHLVNARAGTILKPFVGRCPAGIAEAVVPVLVGGVHRATVFVGQAVLIGEDASAATEDALDRASDPPAVRRAYRDLPRMAADRLLRIGRMVEAAMRGLGSPVDLAIVDGDERLRRSPEIARIISLLEDNANWGLSSADMAARVGLSPTHFSRLFHRTIGRCYKDHVAELRFSHAKALLHHTRLPIGEIASRCGFQRQSQFAARFRALTGMSPRRFRDLASAKADDGGGRP